MWLQGSNKTEQLAEQIAGSKYALQTKEGVIENWSPNNLLGLFLYYNENNRTIVITVKSLLNDIREIEVPVSSVKTVLSALNAMFSRRQYSCIAFICWDSRLSQLPDFKVDRIVRSLEKLPVLSAFGAINLPYVISQVEGREFIDKLGVDILRSCGARFDDNLKNIDKVVFQPATYALDTKLKDLYAKSIKMDLLRNALNNDIIQIDRIKAFLSTIADIEENVKAYKDCFYEAIDKARIRPRGFTLPDVLDILEKDFPNGAMDTANIAGFFTLVYEEVFGDNPPVDAMPDGILFNVPQHVERLYEELKNSIRKAHGDFIVHWVERNFLSGNITILDKISGLALSDVRYLGEK